MPVPQPVVDDPGRHRGVVAFPQAGEDLRVQGGVAAGAGVLDGLVRLAQDGDDVAGPGLQAARAELDNCPESPDDVLAALLDPGQPGQQVLVAGLAVGHQQPGERGRDPRGDIGLAPRGQGLQPGQPPVRSPDDQHVRRARSGLLLFGVLFLLFFPRGGLWGAAVQDVHRVSSAASAFSPASASSIAASNPALPSCVASRPLALSTQPAETGTPSSTPITCAARSGGTFPYPVRPTAAAVSTGPQDTEPTCALSGGSANVTVPQQGHAKPGSAHRPPSGSPPRR